MPLTEAAALAMERAFCRSAADAHRRHTVDAPFEPQRETSGQAGAVQCCAVPADRNDDWRTGARTI